MTKPEGSKLTIVDPVPMTQTVAADMSAIFGFSTRVEAPKLTMVTPKRPRVALSRGVAGAALVGTLAAMAAGIYMGNSVVATPVIAATQQARDGAPPVSAERESSVLPPPTGDVGAEELAAPSSESEKVINATRDTSEKPAAPKAVTEAFPVTPMPEVAPAAVVVARRSSPPTVTPSVASPPPLSRARCDDDTVECLASRIVLAEQETATAYDQAVVAGVRRRDLRGYRGEWNRARVVAAEQPLEALRLHFMIASDLRTLAEDAAEGEGAPAR